MGNDFEPVRTQRLLLRPVRDNDASALVARRNDPEVAAMQDWPMPFSADAATQTINALKVMDGPIDDDWWMLSIANTDDNEIYGDLALKMEWGGRAATVGYTLAREHWGKGYASEALKGLVDWLFDVRGVTRVGASLHPDNLRSAKVLERSGFAFEGHTRNSFWSNDENSDDWLYGLTPLIRNDWNSRPTHRPDNVKLVVADPVDLRRVLALEPHQSQKHFVSSIATSLAEVAVPPLHTSGIDCEQHQAKPWPRVVLADDQPVGFVMLDCPTHVSPEPFLWRLLVDKRHQGRGIGWQVLDLVVAQAREWNCQSLLVSWVEGYGSPGTLYERYGFVPTGEIEDGEIIGRLLL